MILIDMGRGGGRKMLFSANFFKQKLVFYRSNWFESAKICKIHNLHFSAIKTWERTCSLIIARFHSNLTQYNSAVSHKKYVDLTEQQTKVFWNVVLLHS